jgi:hypothetical protein
VEDHYHRKRPIGGDFCSATSLETEWATIKHDVLKFIGICRLVELFNESDTSNEDVWSSALDMYNKKHLKNQLFVYMHC